MLPVIEAFTEDIKKVNTLLQLATLTRNILQKLTLKDIQVVTLPDSYFKFKFITEDGTTIETNSVFIGESISIDDALSLVSTNPVQNKVITAAINAINEAIAALQETALNSAEKEFVSNEYTKTQGNDGAVMHEINVKGNLLWENATPDDAAGFADQRITTASMDGYSKIAIVYGLYPQDGDVSMIAYSTTGKGNMSYVSDVYCGREFAKVDDTHIDVREGFRNGVVNNMRIIPLAIYGIK